ncbi:MAG: Gfo/Idh/MocA family oxidoreductase [Sedimentisphaerales bacterium]|nr:Gfo/Idh/MocA family oxidoreductase [Sedimentisphaerales bacterium]
MSRTNVSRRDFLKVSAAAVPVAAMAVNSAGLYAAGDDVIKVALIGAGGRGSGALDNFIEGAKWHGLNVKVVAIAEVQKDRAEGNAKKHNVPMENVFTDFSGYKKVMATDAEYCVIATSPNFRPVHLEAAIQAGKNVFMEKPVAVDPQGARRIIAAGELAKQKGLGIVAGTQRRHEKPYRETADKVAQGALGRILSARVWWCGGRLWFREQGNDSDAMYMVKNWVSFTEMSGDHIVEQHVHNLDVANWFIGRPPVSAMGFGGRARRKTGNQFDFFSIDYDYGDDVTVHSMCRQVTGCYDRVSEHFVGTNGSTWGNGGGFKMQSPKSVDVGRYREGNPYVVEHYDLIQSVREGKPLNEAKNVGEATMTAIMGRISAYTGQLVRWSDVMANQNSPFYNLMCSPSAEDFEAGPVTAPPDDVVAIPGRD